MNLNKTQTFDHLSASIETSRIPRYIRYIPRVVIDDIPVIKSIKFWQKFSHLNLNRKESRIPVLKSRIDCVECYTKSEQNNNYLENRFEDNLRKFTANTELNDILEVKLRAIRGRTRCARVWTQSEPTDCLKYILEIVRSNLSADNKFRAIKRFRDKRIAMNSNNTFDDNDSDRVRQWVDSGYMSTTTSAGPNDDVFNANEPKREAAVSLSNPMMNPREVGFRRRSYNSMRAMDLIALNNKYNSFNSDISMSSISSIESLLESRREDPEELLLALGFGYVPEDQTLNRIPQRFFESPSSARGVNPENFRKTTGLKDIPSLSSSVSFPSTDLRERSYSCGRITDRFKKRLNSKESVVKMELPEIITSSCSSLLQSPQTESILNAANRKFLESQGKDETQDQLSSGQTKRLIIGTKSYKLDIDGDPLAFPKTPSPIPSPQPQPVPLTDDTSELMETTETNEEQNICDNNDNTFPQNLRRKPLQRQNRVQELSFGDSLKSSMTDMSSELSSSTATLVGTVISSSNENPNNTNDFLESYEKRTACAQPDTNRTQKQNNKAIEAALVVAIQSLRLSLEFYRHQSLRSAKISAQKYESTSGLTEEDLANLSKIHTLRECIHKEIVDMDRELKKQLTILHTHQCVDLSFISQAQVFTEAVKKVKQLLKEQQNIYSRMGLIEPQNR